MTHDVDDLLKRAVEVKVPINTTVNARLFDVIQSGCQGITILNTGF